MFTATSGCWGEEGGDGSSPCTRWHLQMGATGICERSGGVCFKTVRGTVALWLLCYVAVAAFLVRQTSVSFSIKWVPACPGLLLWEPGDVGSPQYWLLI